MMRSRALAALVAATLTTGTLAPAARAEVAPLAGTDGIGTLATYLTCSIGLAVAPSIPVALAASVVCFKIVAEAIQHDLA